MTVQMEIRGAIVEGKSRYMCRWKSIAYRADSTKNFISCISSRSIAGIGGRGGRGSGCIELVGSASDKALAAV